MRRVRRPSKTSLVLIAAAAVPILAYFLFFFSFAVDIPFEDDYSVLAFDINFTNPEWPAKPAMFFSLHNEHRIATLRALVLGLRALSLRINWVWLAFLGNLGILAVALLLWKHFRGARAAPPSLLPAVGILPAIYILFQPQHHELALWAMCAVTNIGVVVFAFMALFFLADSGSPAARDPLCKIPLPPPFSKGENGRPLFFATALVFALLAVYTNGNGIFVWLSGAAILLSARGFRRLAVWLGIGLLSAAAYFWGYARNPAHPAVLPFLLGHPLDVLKYFLSVLGSAADFGVLRPAAPLLAGAATLAASVGLWIKRLDRKEPFLSAGLLFIFLSLAAQSLTRAPFGLAQSLESRYKFYSALAAALVLLGWVRLARSGKKIALAALAVSVVFGAVSFLANVPRGRETRERRIANILAWNEGKAALPYPNAEHADSIIRIAAQRKIYLPPSRLHIDRPVFPFGGITSAPGAGTEAGTVRFAGWAMDDGGPPEIIVRRGPLPSDRPETITDAGMVELGRTGCREGSIAPYRMIYYGFPGRDRMIWEFAYAPAPMPAGAARPKLSFFARDGDGHESLLGERAP